jgi:hypothetical protein
MKRFLLAAAVLFAAMGVAHAQTETLGSQVKTGPGASVNLSRVMYVRTTPGNQYVIDNAGRQIPISVVSITQLTSSLAWREFAEVSPGLFANLAETTRTYCDQRGTNIEWVRHTPELIADGCAAAYRIESFSRAR